MTKSELIEGLQRLYDGFSRSRVDLTPERMDALFGSIGFHRKQVWDDAVQSLLCGSRFPDFDAIELALDLAANALRRQESLQADEDAKRFLSGSLTYESPRHAPSEHEYGQMRLKILLATSDGATHDDVAAMLESQTGRWDGYGLEEEAEMYRQKARQGPKEPSWWDKEVQRESEARVRAETAAYAKHRASGGGRAAPDEASPLWARLGWEQ